MVERKRQFNAEAEQLNAARRLQFGTVLIKDHIPLVSETPHGGYTRSGHSKDISAYSFEDCMQIKHVMAKLDSARAPVVGSGAHPTRIDAGITEVTYSQRT